eukprot:1672527-Pleurochrysis_carterae.AAC.1
MDKPGDGMYEIRWYVKKGGRFSWGQQPAFTFAVVAYNERRQPLPYLTMESINSFLPVPVEVTIASRRAGFPKLTQSCMSTFRDFAQENDLQRDSPQ